ncbi:MAG: MOSC domain-containing protein [Rhodobacteraceae bacterium]|nr:MOSC domain-containing protein [Paracoccaceae bacterium]
MTVHLAAIQRHPIKSHGREALASVSLSEGRSMPWDRRWAVAHARTKFDAAAPAWAKSANFVIGTRAPALTAIAAVLDEATATVTLTHPERPAITFAPDDAADQARFLDWVAPLCLPDQPAPQALVTVPDRGMTDTDYPSVSLLNLASGTDLGQRMGVDLSPLRWRGNLWLDGLEPWQEAGWIGRDLRIGAARLRIVEPITRCKATTANPATGLRDADTLAALRQGFDHQLFGLYARVIEGGTIGQGDRVEVLA